MPGSHQPLAPISTWKIVAGAAAVAVVTAAAVVVLWWAGTRGLQGEQLVAERLDALKVGLSIAVGSGGLFALYLGWRRQRSTEADLDNRERTLALQQQIATTTENYQRQQAEDARSDARERRITELYTKAADQLGSDKAPVRLAGLYALERLAQGNEDQRQSIVNLLCAYLRMPYTPPGDGPADDDTARERIQEREVRLAAQRVLTQHLRAAAAEMTWANIDIDLTNATLINFDLNECAVRSATFTDGRFIGDAQFERTLFTGDVACDQARFNGSASFGGSRFDGKASFNGAVFRQRFVFYFAHVGSLAGFNKAQFCAEALFTGAQFDDVASFKQAEFHHAAEFPGARFDYTAEFTESIFRGTVLFTDAKLPQSRDSKETRPQSRTDFTNARFEKRVPAELELFIPPGTARKPPKG